MPCNALIQQHFDYACSAWYHILTEEAKKKIQITEDKCIRFSQKLDKMHHMSEEGFRSINWLPTSKRVNQCVNTITFEFVNNTCLYYLKEKIEFTPHCRIDTRSKFAKFRIPFHKTNIGQKAISFVVPSLWNSLPELIEKETDNLNTFKHNLKSIA